MGLQFTTWEGADLLLWKRLLDFQKGPTRRVSVRIPFAAGVTCLVSPETSLAGQVKNLSDRGVMLALPQAIPPAARLTVAVPP